MNRRALIKGWLLILALTLVGFRDGSRDMKRKKLRPLKAPSRAVLSLAPEVPWEYFKPVWEDGANSADMALLMHDPDRKLESEFKVPEEMRGRVLFWAQVYGHYDSRVRVIHDRRNPGVIYGVINFQPLFEKNLSPGRRAGMMAKIEKQVVEELKRRLTAAWNARPLAVSTDLERLDWKRLLRAAGVREDKHLVLALGNMRTQSGQKDKFELALRRSQELLPEMEKIFREKGLPVGLTRIPFVESSFNVKARSKVGAMGMWQFTRRTARAYIHPKDKARWAHPMHQTLAAAKWLKKYRRSLPDWGSTITSYNSGTGRVSRMVKRHKLRNAASLIHLEEERQELGFAGMNFYAEVLAANLVEAYKTRIFVPEALGPRPVVVEAMPATRRTPVNAGFALPPPRRFR